MVSLSCIVRVCYSELSPCTHPAVKDRNSIARLLTVLVCVSLYPNTGREGLGREARRLVWEEIETRHGVRHTPTPSRRYHNMRSLSLG